MLTYLINVTGDLLAAFVVVGVTFAWLSAKFGETGRRFAWIGFGFGALIAGIRAFITNTRRLVGGWRVGTYGFAAALILFVLLVIVVLIFGKKAKKTEEKADRRAAVIICVMAALLVASYLYGALPTVYVYPFKFDTGGNGVLSTDFLFRLGGYLLGLFVCAFSAVAANRILMTAHKKGYSKLVNIVFWIVTVLFAVYGFARLMSVLTVRKIVNSSALFSFSAFSNNNAEWYTYLCLGLVCAAGIYLWLRSHTAKEPYATKAEHRKQRALWRTGKRYTVLALICLVVGVLSATWFVDLNTVVITEAPVEEPQITKNGAGEDENLVIPITMVSDGHLHRFGYTTAEGYPTRLIVMLKQAGTSNYGVGLDACEICGEAGYYENNDGQVVCKKCGVVMNTMTIGMKGGCNPIIIDYDMDENAITVPIAEMVKNQTRFKK